MRGNNSLNQLQDYFYRTNWNPRLPKKGLCGGSKARNVAEAMNYGSRKGGWGEAQASGGRNSRAWGCLFGACRADARISPHPHRPRPCMATIWLPQLNGAGSTSDLVSDHPLPCPQLPGGPTHCLPLPKFLKYQAGDKDLGMWAQRERKGEVKEKINK